MGVTSVDLLFPFFSGFCSSPRSFTYPSSRYQPRPTLTSQHQAPLCSTFLPGCVPHHSNSCRWTNRPKQFPPLPELHPPLRKGTLEASHSDASSHLSPAALLLPRSLLQVKEPSSTNSVVLWRGKERLNLHQGQVIPECICPPPPPPGMSPAADVPSTGVSPLSLRARTCAVRKGHRWAYLCSLQWLC